MGSTTGLQSVTLQKMDVEMSHGRSGSEESSQSVDVVEKDESVLGSQVTGSSDLPIKHDIYLHLEILDSRQHKAAQAVWVVLMCSGLALFATTVYLRMHSKEAYEEYLRDTVIFKLNTAFAVVCFSLLLPMLARFSYCIWATKNCVWTRRQRYIVSLAYLQLAFQCVNVLFWLIPNAFLLANKCSYFHAIVNACVYIRWTCWNSIFFLLLVHTHNCMPVLKSTNKNEDPWPDRDNPLYGSNDRDPMVLDGPFWRMHWIRFLYWCGVEASILFLPASGGIDWKKDATIPAPPFCASSRLLNYPGVKFRIVLLLWGCALIIYQVSTQINLKRALFKLHTQPYNCYQLGNLLLLWQKRQGLWMDLLGIAEVSLLYLGYENVVSYILQWTGQLALQVLVTGATLLSALYFLPMEPANEEHIYQAWLQDFAWTEKQIPKRQRALLKRSPTMGPRLQDKPMFCFETALKMLLWSDLVYEYASDKGAPGLAAPVRAELQAEVDACGGKAPAIDREIVATDGPSAQLGTPSECPKVVLQQEGKGLQDAHRHSSSGDSAEAHSVSPKSAKHVKLIDVQDSCWEEASSERVSNPDAEVGKEKPSHSVLKVVEVLSNEEQLELGMQMFGLECIKVIYGRVTDTKVVIAWSSRALVLAFRGTNSLANIRSDAKAWRTAHLPRRGRFLLGTMPLVHKGFLHAWNEVAEEVLQQVAQVLEAAEVPLPVFPVYITGHSLGGALATLAAFDIQKTHRLPGLTCYTLGAPRTGNKAFAEEFTHLCPNCWHVINDRDAVPRTGKLLWLYKRPGERVLLSSLGDIRVRPNVFEINLLTQGFSVKQHLLTEYLRAMGAICVAQLFKYKRLEGGKKGVERLSESPEICKLLGSIGIDLKSALKHPPLEMRAVKRRKKWCRYWTGKHILDALRESQPFLDD